MVLYWSSSVFLLVYPLPFLVDSCGCFIAPYICSDSALTTPSWLLPLLAWTVAHAGQQCQAHRASLHISLLSGRLSVHLSSPNLSPSNRPSSLHPLFEALVQGWLRIRVYCPNLAHLHCDSFFSMIKYVPEGCVRNTLAAGHTQHGRVLLRKWAYELKEKSAVHGWCVF